MSKTTFLEVIKKRTIRIPNLQRDYVQGRNSEKAKDSIFNFITELSNTLKNNRSMPLNFIYGYSNKNDDYFIPIDGQQRLTTLYLLHLYIWKKAGIDNEFKDWKKLDYKVRPSSNRFFSALLNNSNGLEFINDPLFIAQKPIAGINAESLSFTDKDNDLSIFIDSSFLANQKWFRKCWLNDLTVRSCILVFYLLKEAFSDQTDFLEFANLLKKDENECPIYFRELIIDGADNANETYVKMNARGKQLSSLENLKAAIIELFRKDANCLSDLNFVDDFVKGIDSDWQLFVLKLIAETNDPTTINNEEFLLGVDTVLSRFLHLFITNNLVSSLDTEKKAFDFAISDKFAKKISLIRFRHYSEAYMSDNELINCLKDFTHLFTFLSNAILTDGNICLFKKIFKSVFDDLEDAEKDDKKITYYNERLVLEFINKFIKSNSFTSLTKINKETNLFQILKSIYYIVSHSEIDNPKDFTESIRDLNNLSLFDFLCDSKDYYHILSISTIPTIGRHFNAQQWSDECRKARIRIESDDWENAIKHSESNLYFCGQSIFLFDPLPTCEQYRNFWLKTTHIFNSDHYILFNIFPSVLLIDKQNQSGTSYTFGWDDSQHHNNDWRGLLENNAYANAFKLLLNNFNFPTENFETFANRIINSNRTSSMPDYQINPKDFLKFSLLNGFDFLSIFKRGSYKFNNNYSKCLLLKKVSTSVDDVLDLSIAFVLFKYVDNVAEQYKTDNIKIDFRNNLIEFGKNDSTVIVSFNKDTGAYLVNGNLCINLPAVITAIDSI